MIMRYSGRRPAFSRWIVAPLALVLVLLMLPTGAAGASTSGQAVPSVPGYPPVASPQVTAPAPLPQMDGTVPLDADLRIGAEGATNGTSTTSGGTTLRSRTAETSAALAAAAAPNGKVALRALVVAVDTGDWGVDTWKATLDRVGAAYDVLYTGTAPLTADTLVRPDGTGRYNAILLTNNNLLYQDASGTFVSGLSDDEWNLLWAYERDYRVRQATLYNSYGSWPEDYCMRAGSEGGVGDTPLSVGLTTTGAEVFSDLNPAAQIPVLQSYVYRNQLDSACGGQAVLTAGTDVLGVKTTSSDGRERLALNFTSNQYLLQAHLLVYGLFRWASRGLFFGELRHSLNVDVDDWFNSSDHLIAGAYPPLDQPWPNLVSSPSCSAASAPCINDDPGFQMSGHDAYNTRAQQTALRRKYPLAAGFTMNLAYNGGDADLSANNKCYPDGGIETLTPTTRCIRDAMRWVNHTLTHPKMNFTDYTTSRYEINQNLKVAQQLGLTVNSAVLKTGEYSGLGVYNPDPTNDIDPPTDFGLGASNPELLRAAKSLGVKYLHGNMSFKSHQPSCFNCSIVHPLEKAVSVVPDWPTNVAYFSTNPDEEAYFYNWFYGPNGKFPFWQTYQTYAQILEHESDQALNHLATGSIYTHTFHISNLRDYGGGRTLTTDWLDAVLAKYSRYYKVPVQNPNWPTLARYTAHRNAHFAELGAGVDAVYDMNANTVTVTSPASGAVTVTGARTTGFTTYGSEVSAQITLTANTPVTFTPNLLP
jgi:hypothetical protein